MSTPGLRLRTLHNEGIDRNGDLPRAPAPSHRHAAPSGPWPWVDLDDSIDQVSAPLIEMQFLLFILAEKEQLDTPMPPVPPPCPHIDCNRCWAGYPQVSCTSDRCAVVCNNIKSVTFSELDT